MQMLQLPKLPALSCRSYLLDKQEYTGAALACSRLQVLLQFAPPANSRVSRVSAHSVTFDYFELVSSQVATTGLAWECRHQPPMLRI
jgi:hypothetical protein